MSKEDNKCVLVSVSNHNMKNKKYYPQILAKGNLEGDDISTIDGQEGKRISKKKFRKILRDTFNLNRKQSKMIIDSFLNLDVMREDDKNYYIMSVQKDFIKVYQNTLEFAWTISSMEMFKVYCYLLNKWNINQRYGYTVPYRFSIKELCEGCGYNGDSQTVKDRFTLYIMALKTLGFIDCEDNPRRYGEHGGFYRNLKYVDPMPPVVKQAMENTETLFDGNDNSIADILSDTSSEQPLIKYSGKEISFSELLDALESSSVSRQSYRKLLLDRLQLNGNEKAYEYYKNDAEEWLREKGL